MAVAVRERPTPTRDRTTARGARLSARAAAVLAMVASVATAPVVIPPVYRNVVSRAFVFAIIALSINVLIGYAGQVSLGHAAFVGVGAFGAGYAQTELSFPFPVALAVAGATGVAAALVLGMVALRVRGLYLALVTLAYGLFAQETLFNLRALTGGGAGMPSPRPDLLRGDAAYAYLCLGVLAAILLLDWRLTATRGGRAIRALRDDERVAAAWGINVTAFKLLAFVISGAVAGIAGGLFASIEQVVVNLDFSLVLSLTLLLTAVIGGVGSRSGAVQAGILVASLPTLLDRANENVHVPPFTVVDGSFAPLVIALLVVAVFLFFPGGIAQLERPIARWLRGEPPVRGPAEATSPGGAATEEDADGPA